MRLLFILLFLLQHFFVKGIDVTFQVNMSIQIEKGNFNPSSEYIDVAGTFNNWGGTVNRLERSGDEIYATTLSGFQAGEQLEFKFRYNGRWDGREEFPGEGNNRMYTVKNDDNLITVWYNNEQPDGSAPLAILNLPHNSIYSESHLMIPNKSNGDFNRTQWTISKGSNSQAVESEHLIYNFKEEGTYNISLELTNAEGQKSSTSSTLEVLPRDVSQLSWWNNEVFYEVFVRSFKDSDNDGIGDFNGLTEKLDYLNNANDDVAGDLGVTGIWLMPIHPSKSYHGYDVRDYRSIHPELGTMDDFKTFLQEAQSRGIKVIIDFVMNHTSSDNPWFEASTNPSSSQRDWYVWNDNDPQEKGPWGQQAWHEKNGDFYYAVFWHEMPDLNYFNEDVKKEMFDIADFWLNEVGIDGFRLDAVRYMVEDGTGLDDSQGTIQFWKEYNDVVKESKPEAMSIGEAWTSTGAIQPYTRDGGLDLCFDFDLSSAIIDAVNNNKGVDLLTKISEVYAVYPHMQWGTFLSNHDQNRIIQTLGNNTTKLKTAAAIQLTLPGVPFIYYGNEIGMAGVKPDEYIRRPMQWDDSRYAGFSNSQPWIAPNSNYQSVNIENQSKGGEESLLSHYQKMIGIRHQNEALRIGNIIPIQTKNENVIVYERATEDQNLIIAHNLSNSNQSFEIEGIGTGLDLRLIDIPIGTDWTYIVDKLNVSELSAGSSVIIQKRLRTSTSELPSVTELTLFPNPAQNSLNIEVESDEYDHYHILDSLGKIIQQGNFTHEAIDISVLTDGVYFMQLGNDNRIKSQGKFIVAK